MTVEEEHLMGRKNSLCPSNLLVMLLAAFPPLWGGGGGEDWRQPGPTSLSLMTFAWAGPFDMLSASLLYNTLICPLLSLHLCLWGMQHVYVVPLQPKHLSIS